MDRLCFTGMVGRSLVAYLRSKGIRLRGRVLDFGSGPGYLLEVLLEQGVACEGADFSDTAVARLDRFRPNPLYRGGHVVRGLPTELDAGAYDVVFFVETIEHLIDEDLGPTIAELRRLLAPDGRLIVTTPNEEDLSSAEVVCPDCGCAFHPIQHVRSWSGASLATFMERSGFRTVSCEAFSLRPSWRRSVLGTWNMRLRKLHLPHLIYIGTPDRA